MSSNNEDNRRVVHTRINTSLEDWKKLLMVEIERMKIDKDLLKPLAVQHAWEIGDTPLSYAAILKVMQNQRARNMAMKATNYSAD